MVEIEWAGEVAVLRLNRPNNLNALDPDMFRALRGALQELTQGGRARALVLTGTGRAFSAGGNVQWFGARIAEGPGGVTQSIPEFLERDGCPVTQAMVDSPIPVLCAVNGPCAGGAVGMALAADIVLAARSAYFVLPQAPALGIVPDLGATWALARVAGRARAMALALSGERLPAEQAEQWGVIWRCVEDAELLAQAIVLAGRLAAMPDKVARDTRRLLDEALAVPLRTQLASECRAQRELLQSEFFTQACARFAQRSR